LRVNLLFVSNGHDKWKNGSFSCIAIVIIVKFLTNENMKPAEVLMRIREQFGDETLLRIQVYDWRKLEGRTELENMRRLHLLQEKLWPAFFEILKESYSLFS
jgi:hypothetical protein